MNPPDAPMTEPLLEARGLSVGYAGKPVLEGVSFRVPAGRFVGILGPNGTGKSTLLKTLARLLPPLAGEIRLQGRPISGYAAPALARALAYMPQQLPADEGWKVEEIVAMGRFPYQRGWGLWGGGRDREAVAGAIARTGLGELAGRSMETLSGGQRQRVYLARALAQEAPLLLLDEPTSHLDLAHQLEFFRLVREAIAARGVSVIAVLHDLNLAAQFCQRLLVVKEGILLADGSPDEVLEPGLIEEAFGLQVQVRHHPETGLPYLLPLQIQRRHAGALAGSGRLGSHAQGQLHVVAGGGAGERLLPELYRLGYDLTVGVVNTLDSDQLTASRLGLPVISEAPFSALSPENLAILEAHLRAVPAVVVANVAWGAGNLGNLRVLADLAGQPGAPRIYLIADQPISERDFTGGEASRLWERLVALGARVLTQSELLAILPNSNQASG